MNTTRRSSTSARNSCTTGRAPPSSIIWNTITRISIRTLPRSAAQFNQLLRTVPGGGRIIVNGQDAELATTLSMGCWTPRETFGLSERRCRAAQMRVRAEARGTARGGLERADRAGIGGEPLRGAFGRAERGGRGELDTARRAQCHECAGGHRRGAACRAWRRQRAAQALNAFRGVKRRMEVRGVVDEVTVYDDFAHHPTAIETTLRGLRARVADARIVAVLEPRSNTMKLGVHREQLAPALAVADRAWFLNSPGLGLGFARRRGGAGRPGAGFAADVDCLGQAARRGQPPGRSHSGHEQRRLRRVARQAARRVAGAAVSSLASQFDRLVSAQYRAVSRRSAAAANLRNPLRRHGAAAACAAARPSAWR